jgi:hypothetical protein
MLHLKTFNSILDSTLPPMWKILTLAKSHPDYWTLPQFVPRLEHLLSRKVGTRALEIPWAQMITIHTANTQYKAIESNHRLAQTFFPDLYPALVIMLKEEAWANRLGMIQTLLDSTFSAPDQPLSVEGMFD